MLPALRMQASRVCAWLLLLLEQLRGRENNHDEGRRLPSGTDLSSRQHVVPFLIVQPCVRPADLTRQQSGALAAARLQPKNRWQHDHLARSLIAAGRDREAEAPAVTGRRESFRP